METRRPCHPRNRCKYFDFVDIWGNWLCECELDDIKNLLVYYLSKYGVKDVNFQFVPSAPGYSTKFLYKNIEIWISITRNANKKWRLASLKYEMGSQMYERNNVEYTNYKRVVYEYLVKMLEIRNPPAIPGSFYGKLSGTEYKPEYLLLNTKQLNTQLFSALDIERMRGVNKLFQIL
jgi:hypothetical protein